MPENRKHMPVALKRAVKEESGYRCAIPTCKGTSGLQVAHIIPYADVEEHRFENLILLCAVCHIRFDDGEIPRKSVFNFKANLGLVNGRYSDFERRMFEVWQQQGLDTPIQLPVGGTTLINTLNVVTDDLVVVHPATTSPSSYLTPTGGIIQQIPLSFTTSSQELPRISLQDSQRIDGTDDYFLTEKGKKFIRKYYNAERIN